MSTATMTRNGKAEVKAEMTAEQVASVREMADPSPVLQDRASLLKLYEESFDRSVKAIGGILDNTALAVYCQVGADCFDTIYRAKNLFDVETQERLGKDAKSSWSTDDFDDQCHRLSTRCRVLFPHLFRPSKEESDKAESKGKKRDPVRVSDYILAAKAVEVIRPIAGDGVDNLSYFLVVNYLARKAVSFSRTDLTCTIRADWTEFVRINVVLLANGKILVRDFLALIDQHEEKLASAKDDKKNAGKTADQIAKEAADEAAKKKTREAASKESKVRTGLSTSLADAMAGVLTPVQISDIILKSSKDAKVDLPVSALNPETITADDILDLLKSLFMLKRFDVVRAVTEACNGMTSMLDQFDGKRKTA